MSLNSGFNFENTNSCSTPSKNFTNALITNESPSFTRLFLEWATREFDALGVDGPALAEYCKALCEHIDQSQKETKQKIIDDTIEAIISYLKSVDDKKDYKDFVNRLVNVWVGRELMPVSDNLTNSSTNGTPEKHIEDICKTLDEISIDYPARAARSPKTSKFMTIMSPTNDCSLSLDDNIDIPSSLTLDEPITIPILKPLGTSSSYSRTGTENTTTTTSTVTNKTMSPTLGSPPLSWKLKNNISHNSFNSNNNNINNNNNNNELFLNRKLGFYSTEMYNHNNYGNDENGYNLHFDPSMYLESDYYDQGNYESTDGHYHGYNGNGYKPFSYGEHYDYNNQSQDVVSTLMSMFQGCSWEEAEATLQQAHGDFDQAVAILSEKYSQATYNMIPTPIDNGSTMRQNPVQKAAVNEVSVTPTCRYYLQGNCLRADCEFSHTSAAAICKFWLSGYCLKGAACEFSHENRINSNQNQSTHSQQKDTFKPNLEEAFPSLSPTLGNKTSEIPITHTKNMWNKSNQTISSKMKYDRLLETFWELPKFRVDEICATFDNDYVLAEAHLRKLYPNAKPKPKANSSFNKKNSKTNISKTVEPGVFEWVETGNSVSKLYSEYREEAMEHARLRNMYFQEAVRAYQSNNHAAAREVSAKGHHHDSLMKDLHKKACTEIFSSRNNKNVPNVLDLHGLHVSEALSILEVGLEQVLENLPQKKFLYVIIGTGHHSATKQARVGPAVEEYLNENKYLYVDCSKDNRGGMLKVKV